MALRSPSSTPRRDLGTRDSPPADSPPPTSQGGSGNGAKADVSRKEVEYLLAKLEKEGVVIDGKVTSIVDDEIARIKAEAMREAVSESKRKQTMASAVTRSRMMNEVEHMLANLEKAGVEIDGKIASIIEDEVAIIKAEAAREKKITELKWIGWMALLALSSVGVGFLVGEEVYEQAIYEDVAKRILFW